MASALVVYLAKVALHEVNLADAPELLLKDVNLETLRYSRCGDAAAIKIFSLFLQCLLRDSPRYVCCYLWMFNKKTKILHSAKYFSAK